jgi:hypothetical protein
MKRPANIDSPESYLSMPLVAMQGNNITIFGKAKGNPGPGVAIWIIGAPGSGMAGYANQVIVQPDSTGFYSLDLDSAATNLQEGRYHVVVQHPGKNNVLDIYLANVTADGATDAWVLNRMLKDNNDANGTKIFKIHGAGSLQGSDAYEALVQVFEDPAVDDNIVIAPASPAATSTGSSNNETRPQNNVLETQTTQTGGQNNTTAGSGSLLDQVWGFLSGIFQGK